MTGGGPARVRVALAEAGYDVVVGRGLIASLGALCAAAGLRPTRVHVFEDVGVSERVRNAAVESLEARHVTRSEHRLAERTKSIVTLEDMLVSLAQAKVERSDLVVSLGGGVLGDVAGLAAGLHRRGVRVVQCPTTLLAMVDASVGGKTGVNLRASIDDTPVLLKNAVGVFHQPSLVVADVDVLESLPPRELRCGLAECIKHAVIAGPTGWGMLDLARLAGAMPALLGGDRTAMVRLVEQNVQLKAGVVEGDEREMASGDAPGRRALNLGHTFAHAIEACESTRVVVEGEPRHPQHGEAVGLGLIAAAALGEHAGALSAERRGAMTRAISAAGLPTTLQRGVDAATLISAMRQDKKASGGRLRLVMPTSQGVSMLDDPGDATLTRAWSAVIGG
jgi:3-dehydroquinate synthase